MPLQADIKTGFPSIDKPWMKYYSEEAKEKELSSKCMYQYLLDSNADNLELSALSFFGREITYGDVINQIKRTAKAFTLLGIKKGDVVSFCTVTVPEVIYAFYALNMIGAVGNMIDPRTSVEGIESYIQECNSKYIIVLDALLPRLKDIIDKDYIYKVIVLSPADSMPRIKKLGYRAIKHVSIPNEKCVTWNNLKIHGFEKEFEPRKYERELAVSIMHTGGTTGKPKGVLFSDDSYNHLNDQFNFYNMQPKTGDVVLNIMPPFIAYGMAVGIHAFLCCGCKIVLIPIFDPNKFDRLISRYKPQHFWGVPTHLDSLRTSKRIKKMNLSFLKTAGVGGDAIKTDSEKIISRFLCEHGCNYGVTKGYGMTEVNSAVCVCGEGQNLIGSVGIPLIHVVIAAFVPGTQIELPYGEQGEICIQTPSRMLGYINQEEETKKVMQIHSDGKLWIHSGDLGYVTEEGFVYIVDRIKRMIIRDDGFKVYPSIIENVICECDWVTNCAVIGVRNEHFSQGMNPKAFITVSEKKQQDEIIREVHNLCSEKLSNYQIPVEIEIIDEMPLTKVGKINYLELEKLESESNKER